MGRASSTVARGGQVNLSGVDVPSMLRLGARQPHPPVWKEAHGVCRVGPSPHTNVAAQADLRRAALNECRYMFCSLHSSPWSLHHDAGDRRPTVRRGRYAKKACCYSQRGARALRLNDHSPPLPSGEGAPMHSRSVCGSAAEAQRDRGAYLKSHGRKLQSQMSGPH